MKTRKRETYWRGKYQGKIFMKTGRREYSWKEKFKENIHENKKAWKLLKRKIPRIKIHENAWKLLKRGKYSWSVKIIEENIKENIHENKCENYWREKYQGKILTKTSEN